MHFLLGMGNGTILISMMSMGMNITSCRWVWGCPNSVGNYPLIPLPWHVLSLSLSLNSTAITARTSKDACMQPPFLFPSLSGVGGKTNPTARSSGLAAAVHALADDRWK
jgi:hypothetical protein